MVNFGFLFSLVFFLGCSSIKFNSSELIPVSLEENKNHYKDLEIEVEKSSYLWGLLPEEHIVEIDKLFEAKGVDAVSNLEIVEVESNKKFLWMVLSLGLYYPQKFKLVAKATD